MVRFSSTEPDGLQAIVPLFDQLVQKLCNIPFTAATTRKCTRLSGNGIHIQPLLEQTLDFAPGGAATRAHDFIRVGILHVHGNGFLLPGPLASLIVTSWIFS